MSRYFEHHRQRLLSALIKGITTILLGRDAARQLQTTLAESQAAQADLEQSLQERTAELAQTTQALQEERTKRQQAREALRESEETARVLLSAPTDIALLLAADGTILDGNEALAQRTQRPLEALSGTSLWELSPAVVRPKRKNRFKQVVRSGQPTSFEEAHPDAEYDISIHPIADRQGQITRVAIRARDITRTKIVQQTLRQQNRNLALLNLVSRTLTATLDLPQILEQLLRAAVTIADGEGSSVWLWDQERPGELACVGILIEGEFLPGNELRLGPGEGIAGWVARTGQSSIVTDPRSDSRFFPGVDRQLDFHTASLLSVPLKMRDQIYGTLQVVNKHHGSFDADDRTLVETLGASAAIAIENARLVEGLGEQVVARTAEIVVEKEKSEAILRCVGDAISMTDLEWRIRYVNDAFVALTGYGVREILGKSWQRASGVNIPEQEWSYMRSILALGDTWAGDLTLQRKDGRSYDAALTIAPMRDAQGAQVGYVTSHRDISPLKELDRARSRFLTTVSHQLRTPATNLKLYANLLRKAETAEKKERYRQVIEQQAEELSTLVQDLLEMTALDSGQAVELTDTVEIPTLIELSMSRFQDQANAADLTLRVRYGPEALPPVTGDAVRLAQALEKLLENALLFTPPGGQVTFEASTHTDENGAWVTLAVHDTGPGITPEEQEQVFERFYRGRLAESGHVLGTGLGLSIAQEIVRAHGGRLTVESPASLHGQALVELEKATGSEQGSRAEPPRRSPGHPENGPTAGRVNDEGPGCTFTIWLPA
jgi:PAS domain S-box-containing protein